MSIHATRQALCDTARSLFERGYVHGTTGNLSVRLKDGDMLITPTDACLGTLDPQALVHVDAQGQAVAGGRASKALALHRRIYAAAPKAGCVLHTHSHHLVALTLRGVNAADAVLPPITPYQVMKVGPVPLIPYHPPGDAAVADLVQCWIQRRPTLRAVLLERLGPVVWQADLANASALLEELEATARLWLALWPRPAPLTVDQRRALEQRFDLLAWPGL